MRTLPRYSFPAHAYHNAPSCAPSPLTRTHAGHDNIWRNNVIAFPSGPLLHNGYGGQVGQPGQGYLDGHEDMFTGNIAFLEYSGSYAKPICAGSTGTTIMNTSTVYSPDGKMPTDCGATFDVGAVYAPYTATMPTDIIAFARAALQLPAA